MKSINKILNYGLPVLVGTIFGCNNYHSNEEKNENLQKYNSVVELTKKEGKCYKQTFFGCISRRNYILSFSFEDKDFLLHYKDLRNEIELSISKFPEYHVAFIDRGANGLNDYEDIDCSKMSNGKINCITTANHFFKEYKEKAIKEYDSLIINIPKWYEESKL